MSLGFPPKMLRYLGENHPDNRTRKIFFRMSNVQIGEKTVINKHLVISDDYLPLLKIGDRVAISPNVTIICSSGPNNSNLKDIKEVKTRLIVQKAVEIQNDVWIGTNVTIMPGVTIGQGAIIGACSLITKNVEPFSIVSGIPAKHKRKLL